MSIFKRNITIALLIFIAYISCNAVEMDSVTILNYYEPQLEYLTSSTRVDLMKYNSKECPYFIDSSYISLKYNNKLEGYYFRGYFFINLYSKCNEFCKGWNLYAFDSINKVIHFIKNSNEKYRRRDNFLGLNIFCNNLIMRMHYLENPKEYGGIHFYEVGTPVLKKVDVQKLEITDSFLLLKNSFIDSMFIKNCQLHVIVEAHKPIMDIDYYLFFFLPRGRPPKLKGYKHVGIKVEYIFDKDFHLINKIETKY